jgi:hypothetical protein
VTLIPQLFARGMLWLLTTQWGRYVLLVLLGVGLFLFVDQFGRNRGAEAAIQRVKNVDQRRAEMVRSHEDAVRQNAGRDPRDPRERLRTLGIFRE